MLKTLKQMFAKADDLEPIFTVDVNAFGLNFTSDQIENCKRGAANEILQHQFITLKMLVEEGAAIEAPNGFHIPKEDAVRLGSVERYVLQLPSPWIGEFRIEFKGTTPHPTFAPSLELVHPSGDRIRRYDINGPYVYLTDSEIYLPNTAQWELFDAIVEHAALKPDEKTEAANLLTIKRLQSAKNAGVEVNLEQFEKLEVEKPEKIGVGIIQQDNGDLELVPTFQSGESPADTKERLGQLSHGGPSVMRIKDSIVVLDDDRMQAVNEILSNKRIPAEQVRQFLSAPGAFLDGSMVDLDLGFSIRVKGATIFQTAYFGETDASSTDWAGYSGLTNPPVMPLSDAPFVIKTEKELEELKLAVQESHDQGRKTATCGKHEFLLLSREEDEKSVNAIRIEDQPTDQSGATNRRQTDDTTEETQTVVVDIDLMDEQCEIETTDDASDLSLYNDPFELTNCIRTPFDYQNVGIRWVLGLANNCASAKSNETLIGGLLADDMGLGKTFMSLSSVVAKMAMTKNQGKTVKPTLVVAPLSLLEIWRDEVLSAFDPSPFTDIVLLQSAADLNTFRAQSGNETQWRNEDAVGGKDAIRYVLKIGGDWGNERLDMPGRLVLTTYQALRNYQFSLCSIDWGFVIFDEAQNIKDPNALQTRAAKGLRADFRLLATGTPVENSLRDFWCLFDTAKPGLLNTYQEFRHNYIKPLAANKEDRVYVGKRLRRTVGAFMLRRTKEDELDGLPEKIIHNGAEDEKYAIEMCGIQRDWYEATLTSKALLDDENSHKGKAILDILRKLRDVSLHPALVAQGTPRLPNNRQEALDQVKESGKINLLKSILDEIQSRDEKVIVFAINRRLQAYLSGSLEKLYKIPVAIINGETKAISKRNVAQTRKGIIKSFEQREGFNILIMSPIAAGVGLTIVGANNVIHLERHWNPAKEAQATDRVYRIGQEKDVSVYIPILTHPDIDSFDIHLNRLLTTKIDLKDAIVTTSDISADQFVNSGIFRTDDTRNQAKKEMPYSSHDLIQESSWELFEALTAVLAERLLGGESFLTPVPTDWGADVVVRTPQGNVLIQCKHQPKRKLKSVAAIREVYSAEPKYKSLLNCDISKMIVSTTAPSYSRKVAIYAKQCCVDIWDFNFIAKYIDRYDISRDLLLRKLDSERIFSRTS